MTLAAGPQSLALSRRDFGRIAKMASKEAGLNLLPSKHGIVQSRLSRHLRGSGHASIEAYLDFVLRSPDPRARAQLVSVLTTNVSRFFREPHHFAQLGEILAARDVRGMRLWSAGCATGQEPYSMAMTLLEARPEAAKRDLRILATDIDASALAVAAAGVFDADEISALDRPRRQRFFVQQEDGRFRVRDELRALVHFRRLNLHDEWPITRSFAAIFCRNVVIYFDARHQDRLWPRFRAALEPGGLLMIGHSERLDGAAEGFETVGVTTYRRVERAASATARKDAACR